MSSTTKELIELLAELHDTTYEEEKEEFVKLSVWFKKQDISTQLWFILTWFSLDQARIIKHIFGLSKDIQMLLDAMQAVDNIEEEEDPSDQTGLYV